MLAPLLLALSDCPQPIQHAASCECAFNRTYLPAKKLPHCMPSVLCKSNSSHGFRAAQRHIHSTKDGTETILLIYGFNRSLVRYWYRPDPFRSYLNAMRLIVRVLLSLRAAGSTLPVHLLLSGERHTGFESSLVADYGVRILPSDDSGRQRIRVPRWSSPFHWGSFPKLAALSLTQFRRVIVLDTDTVVLRNLDHLAYAPAPAFVYRFKCWRRGSAPSIWEINSGMMVLRPDEGLHRRMQWLMNGNMTGPKDSEALKKVWVPSDPGDQSVWRNFFDRVHEYMPPRVPCVAPPAPAGSALRLLPRRIPRRVRACAHAPLPPRIPLPNAGCLSHTTPSRRHTFRTWPIGLR